MATNKTTYTIRLDSREHGLLVHLARVLGTSTADLSREILSAGIKKLLDPEEIDRRMEQERLRLRAEAERILAEVEATDPQDDNRTPRGGNRKSAQNSSEQVPPPSNDDDDPSPPGGDSSADLDVAHAGASGSHKGH
jgi:hypothetical protein